MDLPGRFRTHEGRDVTVLMYYRRLNVVTVRRAYAIPRMDDFVDSLGDENILSTLD